MKPATVVLCLSALALGGLAYHFGGRTADAWEHPEQHVLSSETPAGHERIRFAVDGMCCRSCPQKLQAQLAGIDGVYDVAVSFETSSAEAIVPTGFDPEPLLAVLNSDKYTARLAP